MTWRKIKCWLGLHGPHFYGNDSHDASERTRGFERTCSHCGAVWYGCEIETPCYRTLGGWKRVK